MNHRDVSPAARSKNFELAKKCLKRISDIASLGALSQSPELMGYALQELSQVLLERTGSEETQFEHISADQIADLVRLDSELEFLQLKVHEVANCMPPGARVTTWLQARRW